MMTVQGNKTNQNIATSAKAIRTISTEWLLICVIFSLGHLVYLLYAVLAKQESETRIRLEALFVVMEACIFAFAARKYIIESNNLCIKITQLQSAINQLSDFKEKLIENYDRVSDEKSSLGFDYHNLNCAQDALTAKNSKLETEYKILQQNHEKLIAERNKLANECNRDIKVKSSSKRKVQPENVSPRNVDINLSGPCRQDPLSALCASVKKEDDVASEDEYSGSENSCSSNNGESTDSDDSYPPSVSDDQDIDDDTNGYKAREFLTFYVGNLHYSANSYQVRKAVEKAVGFQKIVDQVVIAKTSTCESRGCAFVTICWKDHVQLVFDENKSNIAKHTRSYDKYLQVMFNFSGERICGRRVICEVARSQRRD